jgi:hypothetical protein
MQMVRVLDIISDYLRLRGYPHQRLDGSTPAAARHAAMEAFNRPDSPDFAFLLSTRVSGGGSLLAACCSFPSYQLSCHSRVSVASLCPLRCKCMAASKLRPYLCACAGWWSGYQPGHC